MRVELLTMSFTIASSDPALLFRTLHLLNELLSDHTRSHSYPSVTLSNPGASLPSTSTSSERLAIFSSLARSVTQ